MRSLHRIQLPHAIRLVLATAALCFLIIAANADASEGARGRAESIILRLPDCDLYAAPDGDDATARGTKRWPFRSAAALVNALAPGQVGCLRDGDYFGGAAFRHGGERGARMVLRAEPGADAVLHGQLYIADGSNFVTVAGLELDGTHPQAKPSPMVNGDDSLFVGNDVYSETESCFVLGDKVWGVPDRTRIIGNDIHDCGVDGTNQDHGIYVRQAVGTLIDGNVIRSNPDRGVQLFPNGDYTTVRGNVIDGNGEGVIFSGDSIDSSDNNVVDGNIITNSRLRTDIDHYWMSGVVGSGNVVRSNCIWGGERGEIKQPVIGFTLGRNTIEDPEFVRRGRYRLAPGSPCRVRPPVLP